jgi:thymidylate synthase (FAD)
MDVTLLQHTDLQTCAYAIRTCWQSFDKSDNGGEKDKELIDRVGNQFKHSSTLEHLFYTFYISGVSRALLQELARHRIASLSVKSTRYTLKELKEEKSFLDNQQKPNIQQASKYIVLTQNDFVNENSIKALENLRLALKRGIANDQAKYCLPESYKTELTWSINARSLQNFLKLRSSKSALWEIRELAKTVFDTLPSEHQYIFEDYIKSNKN